MSLTLTQARDEILGAVKAAIDATLGQAFDMSSWAIVWSATKEDGVRKDVNWLRVIAHHTTGEQVTLTGPTGKRRYRRNGLLSIQIFGLDRDGQNDTDKAGQVFLDKFDGLETVGHVIFRNCRVNEVGSDGPWYQINFLSDFEYDEIK